MRTLSPRDAHLVETAGRGAVLFGRDDLLAVVATGKDQRKFLHAMLTQDVKGLADLTVRTTTLCTAEGAIDAVAWQLLLADQTVLWTARKTAELLRDGLDKFVIMDEVELAIDEDCALIELVGPEAQTVAQKVGIPWPEADLALQCKVADAPLTVWATTWGGAEGSPLGTTVPTLRMTMDRDKLSDIATLLIEAGAMAGSHAAWDTLRIASGSALVGGLDVDDGSLPLEVGLKAAVDYRKGCYRGQEAIAMMTYRGQIRRHLCWVDRPELSNRTADTGWTLRTAEGRKAGRMGTSVLLPDGRWLGLAMVQRKAFAPGALLTASSEGGETATIRVLETTLPGVLAVAETAQEGA